MQKITYTVGVRRALGLGVTEFKVHAHRLEIIGDKGQLVLSLTDGSEVHVPSIGAKAWRVYPDFHTETQRLAAVDGEIGQRAQQLARDIDMQRQQAMINANQRRMSAVGAPMGPQVPIQG